MQDIIERLDAELRTAPSAGFEIEQAVRTGRAAVRRRRAALAGAGLAAVLAVGGLAWAVAPGGDTATDRAPVAPQPTATPTPVPWTEEELLRVDADGNVEVNPDADVVERADLTAADGTVHEVLHLGLGEQEYYALVADGGYSSQPLPAQGLSLREWAEQMLALSGEESGSGADRAWVRIDQQSRVSARAGVELVAARPDPGLGESFAPAGRPTAVAEVVRDGVTYFLAVRRVPGGGTEAIPYRKDDTITSLAAFLSYARDQYATNDEGGSEGLR